MYVRNLYIHTQYNKQVCLVGVHTCFTSSDEKGLYVKNYLRGVNRSIIMFEVNR